MVIERTIKRVKRPRINSKNTQTSSPGVLVKRVVPVHQKERSLYKKKFSKDRIWSEIAQIFYQYGRVSVW